MAAIWYPAVLERVRGGFSVYFPDLDGCTSAGDTAEEAAAQATMALRLHLGAMHRDGDSIPTPTPLERLEDDPEVEAFARILVRVDLPDAPGPVNAGLG